MSSSRNSNVPFLGKLTKAQSWINDTFEDGSRPKLTQVSEWIHNGDIPGRVISNEPFVHSQAFSLGLNSSSTPEAAESSNRELSAMDLLG